MNSNLFQGGGNGLSQIVGQHINGGQINPEVQALKQGSVGDVMSDLQRMLYDEEQQHEQAYGYNKGMGQ